MLGAGSVGKTNLIEMQVYKCLQSEIYTTTIEDSFRQTLDISSAWTDNEQQFKNLQQKYQQECKKKQVVQQNKDVNPKPWAELEIYDASYYYNDSYESVLNEMVQKTLVFILVFSLNDEQSLKEIYKIVNRIMQLKQKFNKNTTADANNNDKKSSSGGNPAVTAALSEASHRIRSGTKAELSDKTRVLVDASEFIARSLPIVLVGNKCDLQEQTVKEADIQQLENYLQTKCIKTSTKPKPINVEEVFVAAATMAIKQSITHDVRVHEHEQLVSGKLDDGGKKNCTLQ